MAKKVTVDKDLCIGCGACTGICSNIFAIGDDGKAEVIAEVTDADQESVQAAADSCPVQAIKID